METYNVSPRTTSGKGVARKLRAQGLIPSVCYGVGTEPVPVVADPDTLFKLLTGAYRTNIVFKLAIESGATFDTVMVRDYQLDPVRRDLLHADFVVLDPNKKVKVTIPVETSGKPVGVAKGGKLSMIRSDVPVWARPADIPEKVVVDVSGLDLEEAVLATQLELPEGVDPAYKMNYALYRVVTPRGAVEVAADAPEGEAAAEAPAAD